MQNYQLNENEKTREKDEALSLQEASSDFRVHAPEIRHGVRDEEHLRSEMMRLLRSKLSKKIVNESDYRMQAEIGEFIRLVAMLPIDILKRTKTQFDIAFDVLASDSVNYQLVQSVRASLEMELQKRSWFMGTILRLSGNTPLQAVISGLFTVFIFSILFMMLSIATHNALHQHAGSTAEVEVPLNITDVMALAQLGNFPFREFLLAIHASLFGSLVSIILTLHRFLEKSMLNVAVIYLTIVFRPLVAAVFAVLVLVSMEAGLISFVNLSLTDRGGPFLAWVIGFVCGFSQRIARDFASKAMYPLGASQETGEKSRR